MSLTAEQVKGRIKSLAKKNDADARVLIRIYMMERFLERVAVSKYQTCSVVHLLHAVTLGMPILCHLYSDIVTVEESVQNPRIRESKPLD